MGPDDINFMYRDNGRSLKIDPHTCKIKIL